MRWGSISIASIACAGLAAAVASGSPVPGELEPQARPGAERIATVLRVFGREPGGTVRHTALGGGGSEDLGRPPEGPVASGVACAALDDGLQVFVRGNDAAVWTRWWLASARCWSDWTSLGGIVLDAPAAAVAPGGTEVHLYALGTDGHIHERVGRAGVFTPWESLGGSLISGPAACFEASIVHVFARATDGAIWTRHREPDGWTGWESLGGRLASAPAAACAPGGSPIVAAVGVDGAVWARTRDALGWSEWRSLGGRVLSGPAFASREDGSLALVARGTDDLIWMRHLERGAASEWEPLDARTTDTPGACWGGYWR